MARTCKNIHEKTVIRTAGTKQDKVRCQKMINRVFSVSQKVARKGRDMIPDSECEKELSAGDREVFMLCHEVSDELLGTVVLTLGKDGQKTPAVISYLTVDLDHQGCGLGKLLMKHVEDRAKTHGKKKIYLSVVYHPKHPVDELIRWYKSQGYTFFREDNPTPKLQESLEPKYHDLVRFKWFGKCLDARSM